MSFIVVTGRKYRADEIIVRAGAMSRQTMSTRHGLDAEKERELIGGGEGG